jgi:hypothetical protein
MRPARRSVEALHLVDFLIGGRAMETPLAARIAVAMCQNLPWRLFSIWFK